MARQAARSRSGLGRVLAGTVLGPLQVIFASTPAGKVLLLAFLVGLFVAIKTGSNQVMMSVSVVLGLLVADSLANFISTRMINLRFGEPPEEVWAGEESVLELCIENKKPVIPAGNISFDIAFDVSSGRRVRAHAAVPFAPPRKSTTVSFKTYFPQRGEVTGAEVRATSTFPMGLLVDRSRRNLQLRVVVYPRLGLLAPGFLRELGGRAELARRTVPSLLSGDTMGLREYRPGDSLRRVSWRASAHRGRLVVKEFEEPRHTDLVIALDSFLPKPGMKEDLEWLVSLAATLALYGVASGWHLRVIIGSNDGISRFDVEGSGRLSEVMRQLALLRAGRIDRSEALIRSIKEPGDERVPLVLLSLAPQPVRPEEIIVVNQSLRPDVFSLGRGKR